MTARSCVFVGVIIAVALVPLLQGCSSGIEQTEQSASTSSAATTQKGPQTGPQNPAPSLERTTLDLGGEMTIEFVLIPAGEFAMGSPDDEPDRDPEDEGPVRQVQITRPYFLGVYEVTQAQYEKVTGENPAAHKEPTCPVENVSWNDAVAFCERLSADTGRTVRLPTEAEWEYACRAGTTTPFAFGEILSSKTDANFDGASTTYGGGAKGPFLKETTPVGSYAANAWGLYDMHGNVWEWCQDWYNKAYYKDAPAEDPQGPPSAAERVIRGGSFTYPPVCCRTADRYRREPEDSSRRGLGFRVVLVPGD